MKRVSVLVITIALIMNVLGCPADPQPMPAAQYELTISSTEGGSVTAPGEGTFTYDEGAIVSLEAIPGSGYFFAGWAGDVGTISNHRAASTTISMNGDYSITASFASILPAQCSLSISSTTGGAVTAPGQGTFTYDRGTMVSLVAEAEEGYVFVGWTGDVTSVTDVNAASTSITVDGSCSVTANFGRGIYDWYDLDAMRDNLGGNYLLMNNLDPTTAGYEDLASPTANQGKGWQPIGSLLADPFYFFIIEPVVPFTGSLDGQGYELRGLFVGRPDEDGVGLLSCLDRGVVKNLGVVNADVTGRVYVGGLVGENRGTVNNSYFTGSVTGSHHSVGGLVGGNSWSGTLSNCYSTGTVTGDGQYFGGLAGGNHGTVSNCYSEASVIGTGDSVGGLAGANWGLVSGCHSTGSVSGVWIVGGLVGWNHHGTVSNSYSTGNVVGQASVGGLLGGHLDGAVSNSHYDYDEVLINGRNMITIGALPSQDFDQWLADGKFLDVNGRLAQEDGCYLIKDVSDFKELLAFGQNPSLKFRLKNDLNLTDNPNFYIPYLAGKFDGDGHTIRGLSLYSDCAVQVGLFGYLAAGGVVSRVGVENVSISGHSIVGGLVGENDGTVSDSYCTGSVAGQQCVGGLVGWVGFGGGTVINSYYNYDEMLINDDRRVITIGALPDKDFNQWLSNGKLLDVSERLAQEDGYYLINDISDFRQLLAFGQDASLKFRLMSDLNLSNNPDLHIPYLAGEFDGNGHRISNLRISRYFVAHAGLFGYIASGGKVAKLGVENVSVTAEGGQEAGGLAGGSVGTVTNCYSTGSVSGNNGGGLVGWNRGTVSNSYSTASAAPHGHVGGLVGWNYGSEATVTNSYSTGSVASSWRVGGLVGASGGGTVRNSFWDIHTSGQATSEGGRGKTTAEMRNIATFSGAGWSIAAVTPGERKAQYIWNIVNGQTYPFLSWEPVS